MRKERVACGVRALHGWFGEGVIREGEGEGENRFYRSLFGAVRVRTNESGEQPHGEIIGRGMGGGGRAHHTTPPEMCVSSSRASTRRLTWREGRARFARYEERSARWRIFRSAHFARRSRPGGPANRRDGRSGVVVSCWWWAVLRLVSIRFSKPWKGGRHRRLHRGTTRNKIGSPHP